jgi:hypothetical protein
LLAVIACLRCDGKLRSHVAPPRSIAAAVFQQRNSAAVRDRGRPGPRAIDIAMRA